MPIDLLNMLLTLPVPWVLGGLVLAGIWGWRVARQPEARRSTPPPRLVRAGPIHPAAGVAPRAATPPPSHPAAPRLPTADSSAAPPVSTGARARCARPAAHSGPLPKQADLLLVDDSAVVRAKLRRLFEPAGYQVALARDGEEALALLHAGRYALLITDLEMPRLDGVDLVRAVQQQSGWAGMPVLAITGHDDLQAQLHALQAVAGIYRKPWIDSDLLGHVQALVQPSLLVAQQAEV